MSYGDKVELKQAIWQYMLDHSRIQPNGYYGILIYCKDKDDFWRRIKARQEGFKRYDEKDKEAAVLWKLKIYGQYNSYKLHNEKMSARVKEIKEGRNYYKKTLLFLNKHIQKYLFSGIWKV